MASYVDNNPTGNNSSLLYDTNVGSGNFTLTYWHYMVSDTNNYTCIFWFGEDGDTAAAYIGTAVDGTTSQIWQRSAQRGSNGTAYTVGEWHHYALVSNTAANSAFTFYRDGVSDITGTWAATAGIQTGSGGRIWTSDDPWNELADARYANIQVWESQLTVAQIQNQMEQYVPIADFGNLFAWWPCVSNGTVDLSGNGRTFTQNGTVTAADGPPIPWIAQRRRYFIPAAAVATLTPSVTDAVNVDDTPSVVIPLVPISVTDAVNVDDTPAILLSLDFSVTDAVQVDDTASVEVLLQPQVTDAVNVDDTVSVEIPTLPLSVTDAVQVDDTASVTILVLPLSVTDAVQVDDTVTDINLAAGPSALTPTATDAVDVGDTVDLRLPLLPLSVTDAVSVDDTTVTVVPTLPVTVTDAVQVDDAPVTLVPTLPVTATDAVQVDDTAVVVVPALPVSVTDAVNVDDLLTNILTIGDTLEVIATDAVSVNDVVTSIQAGRRAGGGLLTLLVGR